MNRKTQEFNMKFGDSVVCDQTQIARRITFVTPQKFSLFRGLDMRILRTTDFFNNFSAKTVLERETELDNYKTYLEDESKYSMIYWQEGKKPSDSWTLPYVLGNKYKIHWRHGIDLTDVEI
jgi:hypothetical protein